MKIIKKPVLPLQKCENCGCEFEIKSRDLKKRLKADRFMSCPFCKRWVTVKLNASK